MCKLEPDIQMQHNGYIYEYIAMYVNDFVIASSGPKSLMDTLQNKYKVKLKVMGPISYHLVCDFFCDNSCILCSVLHKYIDNMVQTYMTIFGINPKLHKYLRAPLEQGDNPELDSFKWGISLV